MEFQGITKFNLRNYLMIAIVCLAACSSEKRESELIEKRLKERVASANAFYDKMEKETGRQLMKLSITGPIKVSLNLKDKTAIIDTEIKLEMRDNNDNQPPALPTRISWRRYEDGDWQIEFVVPREIGTALIMDKTFEPMMRQLK